MAVVILNTLGGFYSPKEVTDRCGVGCPYDRKQSGIVTWLTAAVSKGATIYTDVKTTNWAGGLFGRAL